jgi:hypothetical protein
MDPSTVVKRLKERMSPSIFVDMCNKMKFAHEKYGTNMTTLYNDIVYPKLRQYGLKIQMKRLPLAIDSEGRITRMSKLMTDENVEKLAATHSSWSSMDYDTKADYVFGYMLARKMIQKLHHAAIWINGKIYHWGPDDPEYGEWRMYGEAETNKHISDDRWYQKDNEKDILYTLRTHEEIEEFCDNWRRQYKYNIVSCNCQHFAQELIKFLVPVD